MKCDDSTIDGLLNSKDAARPIYPGETTLAVGYLQDLLRGHNYSYLHDPRSPSWCFYDWATGLAVGDYRHRNRIYPERDRAGSGLLRDLVIRPAPRAAIGPAYVPLVLDVAFTAIPRFVWLTSLFEADGVLGRLNLNTDQCGVSFGILQWSQKPGQLHRFLQACHDREPAEWSRIMGGTEILDYTAKPNGGLDTRGLAINPAFELTGNPWKSKLQALGASLPIQRVQLALAVETYRTELIRQRGYATAITSERGFGFLLDLANQFGGGRVEQHYKMAARPGVTEAEILKAMEDTFTGLASTLFQRQVRARREFFRTTSMLSDQALPPQ